LDYQDYFVRKRSSHQFKGKNVICSSCHKKFIPQFCCSWSPFLSLILVCPIGDISGWVHGSSSRVP
jgi:hypothetical protein